MIDEVNLALLKSLLVSGVVFRHVVEHDYLRGCDGMMTCTCPDPAYSYRVAPEYRDRLEVSRREAMPR